MKVVIPGGSGQVGTLLARAFCADGHEVVVLSRRPKPAAWRAVQWDGRTLGAWAKELDGADAVVNLAGRSVNCRYTPANRDAILRSRTDSTRVVGEAIARCKQPPPVWLQAGTATIYAHRYDAPNDDITGLLGGNELNAADTWKFSIDVALQWEAALNDAPTPATRKVSLRSAMVMSPDAGGVFDALLSLVRHGLGGQSGNGRQYVSWIHGTDFVQAVQFLLSTDMSGPVNISAPQPLPNAEFMRVLRGAWGIPFGVPAPEPLLELGAAVIGTETELLLKSRRVVPRRLPDAGFMFTFPEWADAARDLCDTWRAAHRVGATT